MCIHYCRLCILNLCGRWLCCTHYYCRTQTHEWTNTSPLPYSPLRGPLHLRIVHALVFKTMFSHRFLSELKQSGFVWPNFGFNISPRASKYLNGSARPYWSILLVWKTTSDVNNQKEFWTAVLVMPSERATWPYYRANYSHMGQCQEVYVLENVLTESCMCANRHAFTPFCSIHLILWS